MKKGFLRNLWDETVGTKPFSSVVKKVFCETFGTELFLLIHDIGFFRNHICGTFFTIFHKWFRRKPQFSRNLKRFRECIEVKNLFKFRKKPFFFRVKAVDNVFPNSTHLFCTRHVRQNIERQLVKSRTTLDERRSLLEVIFDSSESLIQSETEEEFQDRLNELSECWETIRTSNETRFHGSTDFFQWLNQYQTNVFRNHLIAAIRIPINFLDRNGSPRLFYNNDIESMNHAFKNQTNWELRSLSEIIDILGKLITTQKNESIRALYDSGELELLPPYFR